MVLERQLAVRLRHLPVRGAHGQTQDRVVARRRRLYRGPIVTAAPLAVALRPMALIAVVLVPTAAAAVTVTVPSVGRSLVFVLAAVAVQPEAVGLTVVRAVELAARPRLRRRLLLLVAAASSGSLVRGPLLLAVLLRIAAVPAAPVRSLLRAAARRTVLATDRQI